ncbi:TrkH family potassium uptake protein [Elongatibacter sediminis]|uniref:Trk system potassium uptake protein n=1 Tax=Elongatibacter sediminis TaxID=3119006 RepID=A0AAW9RC51_9GAMM
MHWRMITHLFGALLILYSLSFLPSIGIALAYQDGEWRIFMTSFVLSLLTGLFLWFPGRHQKSELSIRDGFLVVTLFWLILGMVGSLPFMLGLHLDFTDAIFESVSGFTTTGATVIHQLDLLPPSILYHRQQIQWLGGMGVIVLAVAILPLLGVGGMQLYKAEASGIAQYDKMTPRIAQTARALWLIYFLLTLFCALGFWAAGMDLFDAVGHAFSTVATGGFSTHDASLGFYDDPIIETIAIFFMLAGATNFALHFAALRQVTMQPYHTQPEMRAYLMIFAAGTGVVVISLYFVGTYDTFMGSFRQGAFQVASILTSTGFATAPFAEWPLHIPLVLVTLSFIGGCVGSTAGGIKVVRVLLLAKIAVRELFHLAHPQAVLTVNLGAEPVSEKVLYSVKGFFVLYVVTILVLTGANMAVGLDLESAFGAVMATVNLLGPGLGDVATTFAEVSPAVKWLGVAGMLVGRLEVFTLLILFLPAFWRH